MRRAASALKTIAILLNAFLTILRAKNELRRPCRHTPSRRRKTDETRWKDRRRNDGTRSAAAFESAFKVRRTTGGVYCKPEIGRIAAGNGSTISSGKTTPFHGHS